MSRPGPSRLLLAGLAAVLLFGSGASAQDRVGVSSAVNPEASGAPPGQAARRLVIGQEVLFNERITTQEAGQTQLLFLDESSMTIGPNSDVTIDQFVYDPRSGTGKLAMTTTKGLLRYVGGKLSKQDEAVTMRTNSATLAVRGGAFLLNQAPNGSLQAVFIYGRGLTVTGTTGASQTLQRPGFAVTIAGPGAAPSTPFPVPPVQLAQLVSQLDGRRGGSGGARTVPTDASVAASGIDQTISSNLVTVQPPLPTGVTVATVQTNTSVQNAVNPASCVGSNNCPNNLTTTPLVQSGQFGGVVKFNNFSFPDQTSPDNVPFSGGAVSNGVFTASVGGQGTISFPVTPGQTQTFSTAGSSPNGGGPVSGTSFLTQDGTYLYANLSSNNGSLFVSAGQSVPSNVLSPTGQARVFAFNLPQQQASSAANIPFAINDEANPSNPTISPYLIVAPANNAIGAATGATARTLQASIGFTGTGPNQVSTAVVQTGAIGQWQPSGAPVIGGLIRGVETESATPIGSETLFSHAASLIDGNGNSLYGRSTISGLALDQTRISNPNSTGTNVVNTKLPSTGSETEGVAINPITDSYGFAQPAVATAVPMGLGANRTTQTLSGYFGGQMGTTASTPAFRSYPITGTATVATDATTNTVAATFASAPLSPTATGGVSSVVINFGGTNPDLDATRSAFVDNATFGAVESKSNPQQINGQNLVVAGDTTQASRLYFVSANTAPPPNSLLPAGASYCQCQILQWGYWGGDLLTGTQTDNTISRIDHAHINFWAAGPPTSTADIASLAGANVTGNYTGHAIGSVVNNGSSYVAAGGFNGMYNFASQTANFAVNNFDGKSFSTGNVRLPLNGASYSTSFGSPGGPSGSFNGSFFGPMAAETGGNFSVSVGTVYSAAGIFAGKR